MKTIKRTIYHCLWAVSVWADAKSMKLLRGLSVHDPKFVDGKYKNELQSRLYIDGRSSNFMESSNKK